MRTAHLLSVLLLALASFSLAWNKEDYEIFRLRDEVVAHEGPDTTFYSFIGVDSAASVDTINKAYRKRSRQLHPDKAVQAAIAARSLPKKSTNKKPGVTVTKGPTAKERAEITKEVNDRYARLGVVANILRGPTRERYDHFLRNGFPRWRGTGYYYARFRPGLFTVLFGLLVAFGGGVHYGAMYIGAKRQREFVQRYISHARRSAWGNDSGVPGIAEGLNGTPYAPPPEEMQQEAMPMNRRQKRMQEKDSKKKDPVKSTRAARIARRSGISTPVEAEPIPGPQGSKKRVVAENGKVLIVDSSGQVFLQEESAEGEMHEYLLDPEEIQFPTIYQTILFRLPIWAYKKSVGRFFGGQDDFEPLDDITGDLTIERPEDNINGVLDAATAANQNGEARKRKARSLQKAGVDGQ